MLICALALEGKLLVIIIARHRWAIALKLSLAKPFYGLLTPKRLGLEIFFFFLMVGTNAPQTSLKIRRCYTGF